MSEWSATFRDLAQGVGALASFIFLGFLLLYFKRSNASKGKGGGGFFEDLFMSRKKRVEKRYLVYRGKHYPRKTVRPRVQRFFRELSRSKWGR